MTEIYTAPFKYIEGMVVVHDNEDARCNQGRIKSLVTAGLLREADYNIILALYSMQYSTKHTMTEYLGLSGGQKNFTRNFKNLSKWGILNKYHLVSPSGKRTPPIYALSSAGFAYAKRLSFERSRLLGLKRIYTLLDTFDNGPVLPVPLLKRVVLNQFHTSFSKEYKDRIAGELHDIPIKTADGVISLDALYRVRGGSRVYEFAIIVARSNPNWLKELNFRLKGINSLTSKKSVFETSRPLFLIICEDELMAEAAQRHRMSVAELNELVCFFTTDTLIAGTGILDNMISISGRDDYNEYDYVRFVLD